MSRAYYDYLRICKSRECVVRRMIDETNDKKRIRKMVNEYCKTCTLWKILVHELRRGGKI
jgi:hypothetical protein